MNQQDERNAALRAAPAVRDLSGFAFVNDGKEPDWDGYAAAEKDAQIAEMVNRFLAWPLPTSLTASMHLSIERPIGTHLMNADEARAMLEYVLAPRFRAEGGNTKPSEVD